MICRSTAHISESDWRYHVTVRFEDEDGIYMTTEHVLIPKKKVQSWKRCVRVLPGNESANSCIVFYRARGVN